MKNILPFIVGILVLSCNNNANKEKETNTTTTDTVNTVAGQVNLPEPFATKSVRNQSKVLGWPSGKMPQAPAGFVVSLFADSLDNPRWIHVTDDGDIFVAESNREAPKSANRITLFKDKNNDGVPESRSVFLKGLNQPFGMLKHHEHFYVANTDALVQYTYKEGDTAITTAGKRILALPGGPRHWTRNIIANADGSKIYIAVGSASNVAEDGMAKEIRRACILEINPDGTGERLYASGLRNPVGMDWAPGTNTLWTAVNERDELGDDLVPDYLTSVQAGGFYGWPFTYFGTHADPRLKDSTKNMELINRSIVPEVDLGSHTASLGLAFYKGNSFPEKYHGGAFIGQHGSWNRSALVGYKVVFVPFANGKPTGPMEDFLTGFIADADKSEVYGRPVGVTVLKDGSLLVVDDAGNKIWRVRKQ
jgi:glucose/arabinose dehydrogenase